MLLNCDQGQASRDAGSLSPRFGGSVWRPGTAACPAALLWVNVDEMNPPRTVTFAVISNSAGVPRLENTPLESASGVGARRLPPTLVYCVTLASVCHKRCHGVSHGIGTSIGVQAYEPRRQLKPPNGRRLTGSHSPTSGIRFLAFAILSLPSLPDALVHGQAPGGHGNGSGHSWGGPLRMISMSIPVLGSQARHGWVLNGCDELTQAVTFAVQAGASRATILGDVGL